MSSRGSISKVKNYTVVQANDLIRNKKDFSLWELRIFALLASHVKKDDDDFQTYKFRIKDLLELFHSNSNNLYEELRNIPERLHSKLIRIPYVDSNGKKRVRRYNLVSMSDIPDEDNPDEGEYILLRFDKDLKPLMLKLGEHFTVYKFYNILKLRSPYIFQLYELLKSEEFRGNGAIDIALAEFRAILQIPKSYRYGNIRQRILDPGKEQFEEYTDITFDYKPVKGRGGKVISIRFSIHKNEAATTLNEEDFDIGTGVKVGAQAQGELEHELFPQVKAWVSKSTFKKWLDTYPEEQVRRAIQYTLQRLEKGEKIENVGGYLHTMIKKSSWVDPAAEQKEAAAARKKKQQEINRKKEELQAQEKQLRSELYSKETIIMEAIFAKWPEAKEEIIERAKGNRLVSYDEAKSEEENLSNPAFAGAFRAIVKKSYPEEFSVVERSYQAKIEEVRRALSGL